MKKKKGCIFCEIIEGKEKSWKVYENKHVYAFLDINPMNKYHTLIIPKNHYVNLFDVPDKDLREVISVVRKIAKLYEKKFGMKNVQIINSSGRDAQQDVFHIHFHIAPRKKGDVQDINWKIHPELINEFDELLRKLK